MTIVITSRFNPSRKHPVTGVVQPHNGTDFRAPTGTPLYAAIGGALRRITNPRAGNRVEITSGSTVIGYSHLSRFGPNSGATVKRGDVIGYAGATGSATGAHLHFDVRVNGKWVDPEVWLATQTGHPLKSTPAPTKPKEEKMPNTRYRSTTTAQKLKKGQWNTIQFGPSHVSTAFNTGTHLSRVALQLAVPNNSNTQVRVRFYKMNYATGKRGYTYDVESKVDSPKSSGTTLMFAFDNQGELGKDERLRAEIYAWDDNITITSAAYRTLEW